MTDAAHPSVSDIPPQPEGVADKTSQAKYNLNNFHDADGRAVVDQSQGLVSGDIDLDAPLMSRRQGLLTALVEVRCINPEATTDIGRRLNAEKRTRALDLMEAILWGES